MDLKDVLVQGLKLENDGREFYTKIADSLKAGESKAMFEQLAKDEVDHYNFIKRQLQALEAEKGWASIPEMELVESVDAVSVIFPPDLKVVTELGDSPSEQEALLFALGIEDMSFKLYYNSAQKADDPEAKKMFMQLAGAEQVHFRVLMQRYESAFGYGK